MKKILVITMSLSVTNGQGRYSVEMIKRLSKDFDITVFTSERPHDYEKELDNLNLKIYDLPSAPKLTNVFTYFYYSFKILPHFIKSDFVHYFSDYPYCTFFCFLPSFIKNRFITVHGTYGVAPLDSFLSGLILKMSFKNSKKVISVSNFTKELIAKRVKLNNLTVINNGISLEKFVSVPDDFKQKATGEKIILSVGNLKSRKGYHVSIPAVGQAVESLPNIKYYIVGSRPDYKYYEYLKKVIGEKKLEKIVFFYENLSDDELLKLYHQCDLFLLTPVVIGTNKFEGFGLVYLEASACGKPVIGTTSCGAIDAIKDGYNGFLVAPENVQSTAEAILKILTDDNLADRLGENGKEWAKKFSWEKIVELYSNIYQER